MKDYTYLETIITNKKELRPQTEKIITNAKRAYYALLPLLKSQTVLTAQKEKSNSSGNIQSRILDTEQRYW